MELPAIILAPSLLRYLEQPGTRRDAFYQAATRSTSLLAVLGDGRLFDEIERRHTQATEVRALAKAPC
jgi:hypothetical protein